MCLYECSMVFVKTDGWYVVLILVQKKFPSLCMQGSTCEAHLAENKCSCLNYPCWKPGGSSPAPPFLSPGWSYTNVLGVLNRGITHLSVQIDECDLHTLGTDLLLLVPGRTLFTLCLLQGTPQGHLNCHCRGDASHSKVRSFSSL
jgi:hypothetical protein